MPINHNWDVFIAIIFFALIFIFSQFNSIQAKRLTKLPKIQCLPFFLFIFLYIFKRSKYFKYYINRIKLFYSSEYKFKYTLFKR